MWEYAFLGFVVGSFTTFLLFVIILNKNENRGNKDE